MALNACLALGCTACRARVMFISVWFYLPSRENIFLLKGNHAKLTKSFDIFCCRGQNFLCLRIKKCLACLIAAEKRGFIGDMALVIFSLHSARCVVWDSFIALRDG